MNTICLIFIAEYFLSAQFPKHSRFIFVLSVVIVLLKAFFAFGEYAKKQNAKNKLQNAMTKVIIEKLKEAKEKK